MTQSSPLDMFLARVMRIRVRAFGGASAGIFGSAGADSDIIHSLKKSAIAFADECRRSGAGHDAILERSQEVAGLIHVLQLTNALSENEVEELLQQLDSLVGGETK